MSRRAFHVIQFTSRFPRVSGDEPVTTKKRSTPIKFSPRERG